MSALLEIRIWWSRRVTSCWAKSLEPQHKSQLKTQLNFVSRTFFYVKKFETYNFFVRLLKGERELSWMSDRNQLVRLLRLFYANAIQRLSRSDLFSIVRYVFPPLHSNVRKFSYFKSFFSQNPYSCTIWLRMLAESRERSLNLDENHSIVMEFCPTTRPCCCSFCDENKFKSIPNKANLDFSKFSLENFSSKFWVFRIFLNWIGNFRNLFMRLLALLCCVLLILIFFGIHEFPVKNPRKRRYLISELMHELDIKLNCFSFPFQELPRGHFTVCRVERLKNSCRYCCWKQQQFPRITTTVSMFSIIFAQQNGTI